MLLTMTLTGKVANWALKTEMEPLFWPGESEVGVTVTTTVAGVL